MDYYKESLKDLEQKKGRLDISANIKIENKDDLSVAYTPGVAAPCKEIAKDGAKIYDYTIKGRTVAVVTDGSAVLGLGNIGGAAGLPVMEGKCALFSRFAGLNAFPIALTTQDTDEIVETVLRIAPVFGGINLEDISAPRCFEIENRLKERLDIPVFHDDQHGTAVVVLAGLINSCKLLGKDFSKLKFVISGAGAAGVAIAKIIKNYGGEETDVILTNSKGIISEENLREVTPTYKEILGMTNRAGLAGGLEEALQGADVFIGVSAPHIVSENMIRSMNDDKIVFAMSNPVAEIEPEDAFRAGARIVATGRSDNPNQINNVLAFPGIFKGALLAGHKKITEEMKLAAAEALAGYIKDEDLRTDYIIPSPFDEGVSDVVAKAVFDCKDL